VVSYSYVLDASASENEETEKPTVTGSTDPFEEAPESSVNEYNFKSEHILPPITESMLQQFVTTPLQLTVEGLSVPAKVEVPLVNLVWLPNPQPSDPDDDEYLPGYSGKFVQGWFKVIPAESSDAENFPTDAEIFVKISVPNALCSDEDLALLNILTISTFSLHQLPRPWLLKEGESNDTHLYSYNLSYSLPIPDGNGGMKTITITPGEIFSEEANEPDGESGEATPAPPGGSLDSEAVVEKTGAKVSTLSESRGPRIVFNHTFRATILSAAVKSLKAMLEKKLPLSVELTRLLRDEGEYVYKRTYHGVCHVDLAALVKPGETAARLRVPVEPRADWAVPTPEELEACPPPAGEEEDAPDASHSPYVAAGTYLLIEAKTLRPLQPKPVPPRPVVPKVGDLIPTRPPPAEQEALASADDEFAARVRGVVEELADEFAVLFLAGAGGDGCAAPLSAEGADARRKQVVFHLNASRRYYDFKERLRVGVARIVRERFAGAGLAAETAEGKRLLADLYAHLQEMRCIILILICDL
jgi:hypothetical protein